MGKGASYCSGLSDEPLIGLTLGEVLDKTAANHPNDEVLISVQQGLRYTYKEFSNICTQVAKGLIRLGIERGDNIAIWATNRAEWMITQFAAATIGAALVPINPAYRVNELEYALNLSESKALLLIDRYKTSDYISMFYQVCPEAKDTGEGEIKSGRLPFLKHAVLTVEKNYPGMLSWRELIEKGKGVSDAQLIQRQDSLDFDDPAYVIFTSGTTGSPKAVVLSHHTMVNNARAGARRMGFRPQGRLCLCLPMYHALGLWACVLCIASSATVVLPAEYFDAQATLSAIEKEKCTMLFGVPTMFTAELEHPDFDKFDLSSLRGGLIGGAPCPPETVRKTMDLMHMRDILIFMGLTEAMACTTTTTDDVLEHRLTIVGTPLPHLEIKIINPETKAIVPRGEQGELCCRGYTVMKEYYKDAEATAAQIDRDRWLHTGDLATMDEDGYVRITGRLKDMVIRGGVNIYPVEIENFLLSNPKISMAQVIGVPDAKFGEELCAWIKLKDGVSATEDEMREFCKGKIAHYKIPRYFRFVNEFPMTASGKIRKVEMRRISMEELSL